MSIGARDEWLVIGFKAQRKKKKQRKRNERKNVGLGFKWGKMREWDV